MATVFLLMFFFYFCMHSYGALHATCLYVNEKVKSVCDAQTSVSVGALTGGLCEAAARTLKVCVCVCVCVCVL